MASSSSFRLQLAAYKQVIDVDITTYSKQLLKATHKHYGRWPAETEADIFLDMLSRGGKRIRAVLVMVGYEMCGGTDRRMIAQAARAIEMFHAYILMIDDVQDRSSLRRGKPTAHELAAAYHRKHKLKGDPHHAGISLALNAALAGAHEAQDILVNLDADPQLRLRVLGMVNRTMVVTAHGQACDIMNELVEAPSQKDAERVLEWKTAQYTIINPLQVGMVLAGADDRTIQAVTPYGQHLGKAFQITDDILGVYGDEKTVGKAPGEDIREGKGTLLMLNALRLSDPGDKAFLQKCLGNSDVTGADLEVCKRIIIACGALEKMRQEVHGHVEQAMQTLGGIELWTPEGTMFLRELALFLQDRLA